MSTCEYCENKMPHIHFYLKLHVSKFKTYEEAYEDTKNNMLSYHNEYGKFGFLTEHTGDDYISEDRIISRAKHAWNMDQKCIYVADKAACNHISELEYLIHSPGFVKFL